MSTSAALRHLGKFTIDLSLVRNHFDDIKNILNDCFVVRAEALWPLDRIEYTAINPEFDEVPVGQAIPDYQLLCTLHDDGVNPRTISIEWQKR